MNEPRHETQPLAVHLPNGRFVAVSLDRSTDKITLQCGADGAVDWTAHLTPRAAFWLGERLMQLGDLSG